MVSSGDSILKFFVLDGSEESLKSKGVIGYGEIMSSIEDVTSRAYIEDVRQLCSDLGGSTYISYPVFINGRYTVYYLVFEYHFHFETYCLFADSVGRLQLADTIPYILN